MNETELAKACRRWHEARRAWSDAETEELRARRRGQEARDRCDLAFAAVAEAMKGETDPKVVVVGDGEAVLVSTLQPGKIALDAIRTIKAEVAR